MQCVASTRLVFKAIHARRRRCTRFLIPLHETTLQELLRYVRWTDADVARLVALHRVAAPRFPAIAVEFYERIREHADAHAVLTGEEQIARLQTSLVRWMDRVCLGVRDESHFAETAKIGRAHVKVGLPQRYMLTAMALVRVALGEIARREMGAEAFDVQHSLVRALDVELAIMLDTYQEEHAARARRMERLESERSSTAMERAYVKAVELAPTLVVGVDASETIRLFNRGAERTTGYPRDEAIGRSFLDLLSATHTKPEGRARVSETFQGRREAHTFESVLLTKAGHVRLVRWRLAYAPGEATNDMSDIAAFAIGEDVTDEAARAERARRAEKLAAVGTLAAGLAHEIRNPLNGAHLHITFLERDLRQHGANLEALEAVRVVGDEIRRLSALVTEFLEFARPKPLDRQTVDVRAMCEHVVALVAADAQQAHAQVTLDLPKSALEIDADRPKLEQVLLNLLRNAIEAMEPRGGRAMLRALRLPFAVVLEVEDEGAGIPPDSPPIFDAFFSSKANGTGLGLPIVHRIVTDHGGTITYDSKPGRTVFRVSLPIDGV
jgi:PAS domain S-box-containing protein